MWVSGRAAVEAGNVGNGGVRAEIEDNLAAGELADAAVVERDLNRPSGRRTARCP